ncbi:norbelladine synthase-like [Dioscorea cayenensis subsp. rotundata]|uniref:Norbelladine synthase-like n=1 Tax=Dioscorea cayennensis subsp. rotundata TaxID=55577 RepID=A0AB40B6Z1_DIOCR|nr:norbelladine synthase-like [Dioscorea cayenensis subsp. rotundata]
MEGLEQLFMFISLLSLIEKFTKIDDEKRIKEAHIIEGGYLQLGFISYMNRLEIIKKEDAVSVIKSSVVYEVAEEFASNVSLVSTDILAAINETVGKYLIGQKKSSA